MLGFSKATVKATVKGFFVSLVKYLKRLAKQCKRVYHGSNSKAVMAYVLKSFTIFLALIKQKCIWKLLRMEASRVSFFYFKV